MNQENCRRLNIPDFIDTEKSLKKMKTEGAIYGLLCPIKKEIIYIGQTLDSLSTRLSSHKSNAIAYTGDSPLYKYIFSLAEQGLLDSILMVVLEDGVDFKKMSKREDLWIGLYKPKGNLLNVHINNTVNRIEKREGYIAQELCQRIGHSDKLRVRRATSVMTAKNVSQLAGISVGQTYKAIRDGIATPTVLSKLKSALNIP